MRDIKNLIVHFTICLVSVSFSQEAVIQGAVPIVSRVHTVSIHINTLESYNRVFDFLAENLGLIPIWGTKAGPEAAGKKMYAGFSAGNIRIEPCGPFDNTAYASNDFDALFFGITLEPFSSVRSSMLELDKRGIGHNAPTTFMGVTDSVMVGQNSGVGFYEIKEQIKSRAERENNKKRLWSEQESKLGIRGVEEIHVGYTDKAQLEKWRSFIKPAAEIEKNVWRIDEESPVIRLIPSAIKETSVIVFKVNSLKKAKEYLAARNLLGKSEADCITIDPDSTFGLKIRFRE